jgi:hypothetical protein
MNGHNKYMLSTCQFDGCPIFSLGAKRLLSAFADQLRRTPCDHRDALIATVLASIATLQLPNRPGRIEPRAKKRRPKNLPLLTVPRHIARELIYAQRQLNRVT